MLKKLLLIAGVVAVGLLLIAEPSLAQSADKIFDDAETKALDTFNNTKTIIFIVGGFGLVVVAFFAIFGKLNWKWFAGLAVGLAILAAAGAIVDYATEDTGHTTSMTDSFGN